VARGGSPTVMEGYVSLKLKTYLVRIVSLSSSNHFVTANVRSNRTVSFNKLCGFVLSDALGTAHQSFNFAPHFAQDSTLVDHIWLMMVLPQWSQNFVNLMLRITTNVTNGNMKKSIPTEKPIPSARQRASTPASMTNQGKYFFLNFTFLLT